MYPNSSIIGTLVFPGRQSPLPAWTVPEYPAQPYPVMNYVGSEYYNAVGPLNYILKMGGKTFAEQYKDYYNTPAGTPYTYKPTTSLWNPQQQSQYQNLQYQSSQYQQPYAYSYNQPCNSYNPAQPNSFANLSVLSDMKDLFGSLFKKMISLF